MKTEVKTEKKFDAVKFMRQQRDRVSQAIKGMTIWAAKAAFEENLKGSLEAGKSADFILLDQDLMTCNPDGILKTTVKATYINGKQVF